MIYRLRVKFVVINMTIVVLMMSVVFGLVYHFTRADLEEKSIRMMEKIANRPFQIEMLGEQSEQIRLPFFILHLGTGGELIASSGGYFDLSDQEFLMDLIVRARSSHQKVGVIKEYGFRYYKTNTPYRYSLVFADISSETAALKGLVRTCALIAGLSFILFLAISIWLSGWAVRPVEKAWKQQRQFVADASHELKTPLTVIMTNAELLQSSGCGEEKQRRFSEAILAMSRQMRGLIEQMLDLARADSGQAEAAFEQVDLSRTAEDSLLLFEPLYFEQGLTLYAEIEEGILIWGLKDRLSQLLDILLDNACKYSSQGGTTWVKLKKQGKSHCILTVENQGPSIDPEDLSQIFKRFYRADPARNTSGSYGLGLSIAEKTVQLHHGKIHAESRDGINRFWVELPCVLGPGVQGYGFRL